MFPSHNLQQSFYPSADPANMPLFFEDPEEERRFLAFCTLDSPDGSMASDLPAPSDNEAVVLYGDYGNVQQPIWFGLPVNYNVRYAYPQGAGQDNEGGTKRLRLDSAYDNRDGTLPGQSLQLPRVPAHTSTTPSAPYLKGNSQSSSFWPSQVPTSLSTTPSARYSNQPDIMSASIPGIDFVFGQTASAPPSNFSVTQSAQPPRDADQLFTMSSLPAPPSAPWFTQLSNPSWGAPGIGLPGQAAQSQQANQAMNLPQMTAPTAMMVPQMTASSTISTEPPSASATVKMLPLTDPTTFKVGGKHDRLSVNGLRREVQPLIGHTITLEEINTFNPHWSLLTEPTRRFMQNGLKPGPAAELQLTAGLAPLTTENKQKVVNRIKKQYSKVGLAVYGEDDNGRWDVTLAEQQGSQDDLTANHWGEFDGTTFGHIKLSDMYGPILPQHWPSGNGRGVTTKCLEWALNNQQQFPDLTTQDWDWIVMQLGPLATTPATPQAYNNLDEEAVERLGN